MTYVDKFDTDIVEAIATLRRWLIIARACFRVFLPVLAGGLFYCLMTARGQVEAWFFLAAALFYGYHAIWFWVGAEIR